MEERERIWLGQFYMSIEEYLNFISGIYTCLFLLFILISVVEIWNRVWKKKSKYWGGIFPCFLFYWFSAILSTFTASMAYDDVSDPNYASYKNWELHDFILHDIKTFLIWLFIGILFYLAVGGKSTKKSIKIASTIVLSFLCFCIQMFLLSPFILALYDTIMSRFFG